MGREQVEAQRRSRTLRSRIAGEREEQRNMEQGTRKAEELSGERSCFDSQYPITNNQVKVERSCQERAPASIQ